MHGLRAAPGTRRGDASVGRSTDDRKSTPTRYGSALVPREASPGPSKMPPPAKKQHPCPRTAGDQGEARRRRVSAHLLHPVAASITDPLISGDERHQPTPHTTP